MGALVTEIRGHIERTYPDCWVEGEISGLRSASSGHIYFTLKDEYGQLPVVLFRRQASLLRFRPEAALRVLVRGRISIYEDRGQLQLIAETLEPVGAGSLQIAFEQLKQKLQQEGLFDASRKRALPPYPRCIGIVTSSSGAVIHDFLNIVGRRHAGLDVLLYPATVQGEQAAGEIAAGIAWFNRAKNVDAIVVARGGGSPEDLAPFNAETLARAIAASEIPVVSAVGHETDFTIADFVADLRAPTPSAAAELLTALQQGVKERIEALDARLLRSCRYNIALAERRSPASRRRPPLRASAANWIAPSSVWMSSSSVSPGHGRCCCAPRPRIASSCTHACCSRAAFRPLGARREHCARATERLHRALQQRLLAAHRAAESLSGLLLQRSPSHRFQRLRQTVDHLQAHSERSMAAALERAAATRRALDGRLGALSPLAVLDRGYSLTFTETGQLLRESSAVNPGQTLKTRLRRGTVTSTAVHIEDGI